MKRLLASCTAALMLLASTSAIAQDSTWTARAGTIFLHRSNSSAPILRDGTTLATAVSASQLDFKTEWGIEGVLTRQIGSDNALELRYFQVDGWKAASTRTLAPAGLNLASIDLGPSGFNGNVAVTYKSELHSAELNVIKPASSWLNLLAGFRWVEVDESLLIDFLGPTPLFAAPTYKVDTDNHLYGFQLGADGLVISSSNLEISFFSKVGMFANVADQSTSFGGFLPNFISPARNGISDTVVSLLSELGVSATLWLTSNWSVVAGYQAMWIEGVALAPDQIPNMSSGPTGLVPAQLDMSGIFYQGGFISLMGTF